MKACACNLSTWGLGIGRLEAGELLQVQASLPAVHRRLFQVHSLPRKDGGSICYKGIEFSWAVCVHPEYLAKCFAVDVYSGQSVGQLEPGGCTHL